MTQFSGEAELVRFRDPIMVRLGPELPCWVIGLPDLEKEGQTTFVMTFHNADVKLVQAMARTVSGWFGDIPVSYIQLKRCRGHKVNKADVGDAFTMHKVSEGS